MAGLLGCGGGGGGSHWVGHRRGVSGSLLCHPTLSANRQEVLDSADLLILTGD